jgi:hypothetical protein
VILTDFFSENIKVYEDANAIHYHAGVVSIFTEHLSDIMIKGYIELPVLRQKRRA